MDFREVVGVYVSIDRQADIWISRHSNYRSYTHKPSNSWAHKTSAHQFVSLFVLSLSSSLSLSHTLFFYPLTICWCFCWCCCCKVQLSQVITDSALFIPFVWLMFCQRLPRCPLAWLWLNSTLLVRSYLINKHTFNSTFTQNHLFHHSGELDC